MSAKDADGYLAKLSADKRATLAKVREAIRAAAPDAEEGISYGMPAFIQGKPIAGYNAAKDHCAYFPMSGAITARFAGELAKYEVSKGGFRFPIGKPPPAALIKKLVKARLAEIADGAKPKKAAAKRTKTADGDVEAYLRTLKHPLKTEFEAVRLIILGVSSAISEGVKWNAPSFQTEKDWFATINVRSTKTVQLIVFLGVKKRPGLKPFKLADPNGLVKWLADDRILVTLGAGRDIPANRKALEAILRAWLKQL